MSKTKNLFDGAKFGDRFLTRDKKLALFCRRDSFANTTIVMYIHDTDGSFGEYEFFEDGRRYTSREHHLDIVSRQYDNRTLNRACEVLRALGVEEGTVKTLNAEVICHPEKL